VAVTPLAECNHPPSSSATRGTIPLDGLYFCRRRHLVLVNQERLICSAAATLKNVGWHSVVGANLPSPQQLPRPRSVVRASERCKPAQASLVDSSGRESCIESAVSVRRSTVGCCLPGRGVGRSRICSSQPLPGVPRLSRARQSRDASAHKSARRSI